MITFYFKKITFLTFSFLLVSSLLLNAQVGIGTNTPNESSILDIVALNKGVSLPNVNITSENDNITVPNPKKGLIIFNDGSSIHEGFYYNSGTTTTPKWTLLSAHDSSKGSFVAKIPFSLANPSHVLSLGDIEVRYNATGINGYSQIRFKNLAPGETHKYVTFNTENWTPPSTGRYNSTTTCLGTSSFTNICGSTEIKLNKEFNSILIYIFKEGDYNVYNYKISFITKSDGKSYTSLIMEKY
ncbi:hypothetical protein UJ101_01251 [Flavobacteriaceae bacterium UJ101]|nr:hypothetical protein UJ101_01251 [Flavobacteriaceae bacterium UJ101]